jgi:hypothetical protein
LSPNVLKRPEPNIERTKKNIKKNLPKAKKSESFSAGNYFNVLINIVEDMIAKGGEFYLI